jgi:hypothetical protein
MMMGIGMPSINKSSERMVVSCNSGEKRAWTGGLEVALASTVGGGPTGDKSARQQ